MTNVTIAVRPGTRASASSTSPRTAEECQRLIVAKESQDRVDDDDAIAEKLDLGVAAGRPMRQVNRDLYDAKAAFYRFNCQLSLYLKTAPEERQPLDEFAIESAIA